MKRGKVLNFTVGRTGSDGENIEELPASTISVTDPNKQLLLLAESIEQGIVIADNNHTITYANSRISQILGRTPNELVGKKDYEAFLPKAVWPEFIERKKRRANGISEKYELDLVHKEGRLIPVTISGSPLLGEQGEIIGACAVITDLSMQRETEAALRHKREEWQLIFDSVPAMIWIKDCHNRIVRLNSAAAESFGMNITQIEGKSAYDLYPDEASKYYEADLEVITSGKPKLGILEPLLTKDGDKRWVQTDKVPYRDASGSIAGVVVFAIDITDQLNAQDEALRLQRQLAQAQKMEAIGQLAAGLAHDLNNALTAIEGHLQLIDLLGGENPEIIRSVKLARGGCEQSSSLIRELLGFARHSKMESTEIDIGQTVIDTVEFLSKVVHRSIRTVYSFPEDAHLIRGDRNQLRNVLTNLIINACHAMPKGGELAFSLDVATFSDASTRNARARDGEFIRLKISDSGCGISPENLDKIFEPFFTTKKSSGGSGLGLAMVYTIIQQHGGWIEAASELNKGTTFSIYLPLVRSISLRQGDIPSPTKGLDGIVLVIDDEPSIGGVIEAFLLREKISVQCIGSFEQAANWLGNYHKDVSAILLDMHLPNTTVNECFEIIREIDPSLPIILMSGYPEGDEVRKLIKHGASGFLSKPFQLDSLLTLVKAHARAVENN